MKEKELTEKEIKDIYLLKDKEVLIDIIRNLTSELRKTEVIAELYKKMYKDLHDKAGWY